MPAWYTLLAPLYLQTHSRNLGNNDLLVAFAFYLGVYLYRLLGSVVGNSQSQNGDGPGLLDKFSKRRGLHYRTVRRAIDRLTIKENKVCPRTIANVRQQWYSIFDSLILCARLLQCSSTPHSSARHLWGKPYHLYSYLMTIFR